MSDADETPVVVNPSPVRDQASTATRDVLLVVSALPALLAVVGTHDVVQITAYIASVQFAPALGIITTATIIAWRQLHARRKKAELVKITTSAPDAVAVLKGQEK